MHVPGVPCRGPGSAGKKGRLACDWTPDVSDKVKLTCMIREFSTLTHSEVNGHHETDLAASSDEVHKAVQRSGPGQHGSINTTRQHVFSQLSTHLTDTKLRLPELRYFFFFFFRSSLISSRLKTCPPLLWTSGVHVNGPPPGMTHAPWDDMCPLG